MWRDQSGFTPQRHQFASEFLARTVRGLPRIMLERDDLVANEASRPLLKFDQLGRE
jgi:hypothetical protein